MAKKEAGAFNSRAEPDPRYDPASDAENREAHETGGGADDEAEKAETDIQATVKRMLEDAVSHYETELEPEQTEATDYYKGRPFGDEKEGRSKIVSTDVRDATLAQMDDIMEIIYSPERVVEFKPRGIEDGPLTEQQTDGINYIVTEESDGYLVLHDWVQDGLVRKIGVVKVFRDEVHRVEAHDFSGLDENGLGMLAQDESVESIEITEIAPDGTQSGRVTRRERYDCTKIVAVPNEEFVYTPNARSLDTAALVAHVREVPADELIAMGIDEELVKKHAGKTRSDKSDDLEATRQFNETARWDGTEKDMDPSQQPVLFAEAYALVDGDGDGIAERRLFQCLGPDYEIVPDEDGETDGKIVDPMVPFAVWSPYRQAHTIVGDSNHDLLKTVQRVKSHLLRLASDSFSLAVNNKQEVVQGQVNMADLLNDEIGGFVRVRAPGMVREIGHTFVGEAALPLLGYFDGIKEDRTGTSRAAAGLDADALQSSTKAAVSATVSARARRTKSIVRMLAETGMKRLFKLVAKLEATNQNGPRMMRLRNKWVPVDPRAWDASLDVIVNVGLGQGTPEDKINALGNLMALQKEMQMLGAPFVGFAHLRESASQMAQLAGFRHPEKFFEPWGAAEDQQMKQAQAQQPPQPDPNMALVQVEQMKAQSEAIMAEKEFALEEWKARMQDDRERDKIAREMMLKERELELKFQVEIEDARLRADVARERAAMDADIKMQQAQHQPAPAA